MYYIYNPFYKENTFYINKKSWYFAFDYYMNAVYETLKKYINIKFIHKIKDIKNNNIKMIKIIQSSLPHIGSTL